MIVDEAGALWLTNPWIVGITLAAAVVLVVWCHRWLETGSAPRPKSLALRGRGRIRITRPQALRSNRVGSQSLTAPLIQFSRAGRPSARTRSSKGLPKSAA
jgi:hypothetical protein